MPNPMLRLALLSLAIIWAVGCDNGLIMIKGTVTLDGEPLQGATVTFMRSDGKGRPAAGLTSEAGTFELTSFQINDGLPPGEYRVTITKVIDGKDFKTSSSSIEEKHRVAYAKAKSFSPEFPALKKVLPPVYENPQKTPFSCTVPLTSELRFDVESSPSS